MVLRGPAVQVGVILLSVVGLWIGARLLVDAAVRLARRVGFTDIVIGLTIVAMGTSTPELVVSVDAAYKGFGDIAVANVLGSNIYNLAFILGVISLVRAVPITGSLVHRDGVTLLGSVLLGGIIVWDLRVTRPDAVLLVGAFIAYTAYLFRSSDTEPAAASRSPGDEGVTRHVTNRVPGGDVGLFAVGLAVVLVSGDSLVVAASALARGVGIADWVIGGTIVAAGTSTPEFAVSLVALRRGSLGVSIGNVLGSNVLNITGILGAAALVSPLAVSAAALETLGWLAGISVLMVAALWTGRMLSRVEGGLFAVSEIARWVLNLLGGVG